ncbi:hypothetical protein FNT36_15965 [Hymenobacter setariae]|uniref:Uncharacterized protein n=1 Tax=Hymenobacter setariae TaxID=2594794 RepID=A0A558BRL2_9BACT|nr:hypothetical protein [Hymenobacter setariae]TVT39156.1 hypothetical protein FNT36_15965 [Hymenobacter setariae]
MKAAGKLVVGILALPVVLTFGYLYAQREPKKLRFYFEDNLESDVWRIPIIEPYQLITADGRSKQQAGYSRWNFQEPDFNVSFYPDSINYRRGFITFHDASQNKYGVCDVKLKNISFCYDYKQFREFVATNNLSKSLYNTELVYEGWSETRLLPWAKEILEQRWNLTSEKTID